MFVMLILVSICLIHLSSQSISSQSWSNVMQDLTGKFSENSRTESHPLNEGFMLLPDPAKKIKGKPTACNTSSTTCPTITMITTKTTKKSTSSLVDHSVGHLGRRLLNEPSYDLADDVDELSRHLINSDLMVDGSGDTTEETTEPPTTIKTSTTTSTTPVTTIGIVEPVLSNNTKFIIEINCTNANDTFEEILQKIKTSFSSIQVSANTSNFTCDLFGRTNFTLEFTSDNDTSTITDLFTELWNVVEENNGKLFSDNLCDRATIDLVLNVTSCYVINKCSLCGKNPVRGICFDGSNESSCTCFRDPLVLYTGPLCRPERIQPLELPSDPTRWTPVIVGILAGVTGLFCAITCCLWTLAVCRRRHTKSYDFRISRVWKLPRAQVPTSVTSENVQDYLDKTNSTISSANTIDTRFFRELDENFPKTVSPSDTSSISTNYDPIHELDAIIDNEDVEMTFHDPLNELYEDADQFHEFVNPNLEIPRANLDSQSNGLFSFLNNIF